MTKKRQFTPEETAEREQKRARILESLRMNAPVVEAAEAALDKVRNTRRDLILLALAGADEGENLFSYDDLTTITGMSKSNVFKIAKAGRDERAESST